MDYQSGRRPSAGKARRINKRRHEVRGLLGMVSRTAEAPGVLPTPRAPAKS